MVRQAQQQDLQSVAQVHSICFPDSFSTALGKKLLVKFYEEYFRDVPELFLVAENEPGQIIGFCMGYYCGNNPYMKRFFKNNPVRVALRMVWLLLSGNRAAWKKVKGMFARKNAAQIINTQYRGVKTKDCGDLLSICVLAEHRGTGAAQDLMDRYQQVLLSQGRRICLLSVAVDNPRGIRFYERNGFVPYRQLGDIARTYIKPLE